MSINLESILRKNASAYLTAAQLSQLLGRTSDSIFARLNRAIKKGQLTRVKHGLYCIADYITNKRPHPFELAQFIYGPSYINLESALSYHGLIPEAVHSITSVSIYRNKSFS